MKCSSLLLGLCALESLFLIIISSTTNRSSCRTINDAACVYPLNSRCNVLRRQCHCPLGYQLNSQKDQCHPIECTSDDHCNLNSDYHLVCSNSSHRPQHFILDVHGQTPKATTAMAASGVCICNPAYFYPSADGFACQLRQRFVAGITFAVVAVFGLTAAVFLHLYGPCWAEDDF